MSKILYISSFNERLYKLSATRLINSYLGLKIEGENKWRRFKKNSFSPMGL